MWLERELATGAEPIVLVSHAPILTVTGFLESKVELPRGRYVLPSGWMVSEVDKLKELFLRYPRINLRLAVTCIRSAGSIIRASPISAAGPSVATGGMPASTSVSALRTSWLTSFPTARSATKSSSGSEAAHDRRSEEDCPEIIWDNRRPQVVP